jgi:hypothetical protein
MGFNNINDSVLHTEEYDKYYIGIVVENNDPLGLGRIKANVPGLYEKDRGELPWIAPHRESPFGFGKSNKGPYGWYGVPQIDAPVKVELQDGDEHKPLYSYIHLKPHTNPLFKDANHWGYQDPSGNILDVDMQNNIYKFTHSSGATVTFNADGTVTSTNKGETHTIDGNLTITVSGNVTINVQGTVNVTSSGTATYQASEHHFIGPIIADNSISAAGSITDSTGSGNTKTMADMRNVYNGHQHSVPGVEGGGDTVTSNPPNQQTFIAPLDENV